MQLFVCILKEADGEEKELFTDSFKHQLVNGYYVIEGKYKQDVFKLDEKAIGGNKSAEAGEEEEDECNIAVEADAIKAADLVRPIAGFDTVKEFQKSYKKYIGKIMEKNKSGFTAEVKKGVQETIKRMSNKELFAKLDFFVLKDDEYDAEYGIVIVENDSDEPKAGDSFKAYVLAAGVKPVKC